MYRWGLEQRQLSVSTRALSRNLAQAIDAAARAGFARVEMWEEDAEQLGGYRSAAKRIHDAGLKISSFQVIRDVDGVEAGRFVEAMEFSKSLIEHAAEVGADSVLACSSLHKSAKFDEARAADQLGRIAEIAADANMPLAFECLSMARHRNRWSEAWSLIERINNPILGLALDTTHSAIMEEDIEAARTIAPERIAFVQLADLATIKGDVFDLNRRHRLFPGEGSLDFEPFMAAILATGYAGTVSLEVFNADNMERDANDNAARAMASFLAPKA